MARIKLLVFSLILLLVPLFAWANADEDFYKALQTCTPYLANGVVDVSDVVADYKSQIVGWEDNKCVYRKYINLLGTQICTTCRFNQNQINDIVSIMQRYKTGYSATGEEIDIYTIEEMKKSPVVSVWNKYFEDPDVCKLGF